MAALKQALEKIVLNNSVVFNAHEMKVIVVILLLVIRKYDKNS